MFPLKFSEGQIRLFWWNEKFCSLIHFIFTDRFTTLHLLMKSILRQLILGLQGVRQPASKNLAKKICPTTPAPKQEHNYSWDLQPSLLPALQSCLHLNRTEQFSWKKIQSDHLLQLQIPKLLSRQQKNLDKGLMAMSAFPGNSCQLSGKQQLGFLLLRNQILWQPKGDICKYQTHTEKETKLPGLAESLFVHTIKFPPHQPH